MADEKPKNPGQPFFIGAGQESAKPVQPTPAPPLQATAPPPVLLADKLMQQAREQQLADQKKAEQLRQVGFQVDLRHRRATNSMVSSNLWAMAAGVALGFLAWRATR